MDLPPEINYEIFYYLPIESVLNACQSDPILSDICTDDTFWKNKFKYDYAQYIDLKPLNITWKQAYMELARNSIKIIPLYFMGKEILEVWISKNNTERDVYNYIMNFSFPPNRGKGGYFIHILLNTPNRHQIIPVLEPVNNSIMIENPEYSGSLWDNIFGFEIIQGQIHVDYDARQFYLLLPNRELIQREF